MRPFLVFGLLLMGVMLPAFYIQQWLWDVPNTIAGKALMATYLSLSVVTLIAFVGLVLIHQRKPEVLGFLFFGFSAFKFLVYFIFIGPLLDAAKTDPTENILIFFVPYGLSSTLEILALIKLLKDSDSPPLGGKRKD